MADYQFNPDTEVWKAISNYPGYEVSDHGRVRSYWRKNGAHSYVLANYPVRVLKPIYDKGYLFVGLHKNGKQYKKPIHQLVLTEFVGERPLQYEACHNDGKKSHNHVNNLRWDTNRNNQLDKWKHGAMTFGENHHNSKLTIKAVKQIRLLHNLGVSKCALAKRFNVTRQNISSIINRGTWAYLI
jgi:hypothetical protein